MTGFADKDTIAALTAKMLIEVEAVRFMTEATPATSTNARA